VLIKIGQW